MNVRNKKLTYTTKYVILACLFLLSVNFLLGIVLATQSKKAMIRLIQEHMLDVANTAAASLDGDLLFSITADDVSFRSDKFREINDSLILFQNHMNMKYIYAVRHLGGKNFVFVVDPDPIDPGKFGEPVVYTEALYQASQGIASVDNTPFSDRWGNFYSAYSPVYDSEGNIAGIVGVDYDANWYEEQVAINTASIIIICAFSLLIGAAIIVFATNRFRKKIKGLYLEMAELSNEMTGLNREMTSNADLQKKSSPFVWNESGLPDSDLTTSSFDALGDKIRQTHMDIKQYVSYVREQDYTDALTGVGNKTAYLEVARDLELMIQDKTAAFSILAFDVNNLRKANSKYGLKVGDQMIIDTATLLLKVFDPKNIFRIGSDEFIVITDSSSKEPVSSTLHILENELEAYNEKVRTYEMTLSISSGVATFTEGQDHQFDEVLRRAMENLSQHKAIYYQQAGDRRRR